MDAFSMDNVVLSEWPDDGLNHHNLGRNSAVNLLHGSNPWMPAYGFQVPGSGSGHDSHQTVLEKEDFLDSADADLFLHNSSLNGHYVYLETIQEETSDELQSDSDRSESRASPQGWLATDSESGSVIRISILEDVDSGSEREIACPAKRRRQDYNHLTISDDESSLSRSSSLLQFESLEKQCQDISSSSPSIFSTFSYDSLENQRNKNVSSPDSLEHPASDAEQESSYYKMLKIDLPTKRSTNNNNNNSSFYNETQCVRSDDSSESADSDETLETPQYDSCKSVNNLRTWRSFDCLSASNGNNSSAQKAAGGVKDKMSTENLSEDSGYSDNFCNGLKCISIPNVLTISSDKDKEKGVYKTRVSVLGVEAKRSAIISKHKDSGNDYVGFDAYDGDVHPNFTTNFGVSYQDLSAVDKYDVAEYRSPLIDRFMRNGAAKRRSGGCVDVPSTQQLQDRRRNDDMLNIDSSVECARLGSKITATTFASVPNLQLTADTEATSSAQSIHSVGFDQTTSLEHHHHQQCFIGKQSYFEESVCVSSVPSDLNLAADLHQCVNKWSFVDTVTATSSSIAEKSWDIGDLTKQTEREQTVDNMPKHKLTKLTPAGDKIVIKLKHDSSSISSASDMEVSSFIREASYLEAMANSIDISDDERQKKQRTKPKTTLAEFDQRILKAISETSMNSFCSSTDKLQHSIFSSTPISNQKRNVISTPNLSSYETNDDESADAAIVRSKGSIECLPVSAGAMYHSTSTSGLSAEEDIAEQQLLVPTKSFSGSTSSKGVHFSPVVSEVNWCDDSESTIERESSYSLSSTPERELNLKSPQVVRPEVRKPTRMSTSQPELQKVKKLRKINVQKDAFAFSPVLPAVSQPEMGLLRRDDDDMESDECDGSDNGRLDLQATKNYVVKRYLSCDEGVRALYNRSPITSAITGPHQRGDAAAEETQQRRERCASASSANAIDAVNRRAAAVELIGCADRNARDAHSPAVIHASYTSLITHSQMDRKKGENNKKKGDKEKKEDKAKEKQTTVQRIGGLWQKFSHFRFSTRAKSDTKALPSKTQVKSDTNSTPLSSSTSAESHSTSNKLRTRSDILKEPEGNFVYSPTGQRYATKDDYIHIPLRGPAQIIQHENTSGQTPKHTPRHSVSIITKLASNNNVDDFLGSLHLDSAGDFAARDCVSGKPPLPVSKLPPPRVIGLSMKAPAQPLECPQVSNPHIDQMRQKPPRQHRPQPSGKEGASTPSGSGHANHPSATSKTTAVVATSSSTPMGLIETDLDTEVTVITSGVNAKTRSLMNLGATESTALRGLLTTQHHRTSGNPSDYDDDDSANNTDNRHQRPHKSMEFLLDKQNLRVVEPPENNLQKLDKNGTTGNVMLSEHELRVQRSLSRLTVPEWFKRYQQQRQSSEGLILPRKSYTANSTSALHNVVNQRERWPPASQHTGTLPNSSSNGRTASFNSLTTNTNTGNVQSSAHEELMSDQQQFVRWSKSSKISSAASSPCQSTRGSFNLPRYPYTTGGTTSPSSLRSSFNGRAPYMGWRSQERLNRTPRTPAERLANSILLAHHQDNDSSTSTGSGLDDSMLGVAPSGVTAEKLIEVTSAIAHFVNDSGLVVPEQRADDLIGTSSSGGASSQETVKLRSRSVSPAAATATADGQQRKYWMESSFVGTKPLDSPQTPLALDREQRLQQQPHQQNDGLMFTGLTLTRDVLDGLCAGPPPRQERTTSARLPSPASATLEDVLDSLLGLPSASRASSPRLGLPEDQTGSASHELVPSPNSAVPTLLQHQQSTLQPAHQSQHIYPRPLLGDNEATYESRCSDDDHRVPIGLGAVRRHSGGTPTSASPSARRRCLPFNGAVESCLRMPVDTDDDDQLPPQVSAMNTRRVSWEDEVRLYADNEREDLVVLDVMDDLPPNLQHGRILLQCNKVGCPRTAFPNSPEGREFRPCHNCATIYCTRQCRREDWDLHRVTCDIVRVQNIIRQTIICIRRLPKVMDSLSVEARRGYIFRGPGTVKMYFGSVERAEQFLEQGASALGQFGYIAWTELLPGELENAQYCAMVELCRNYNPENRFILYIVVCVEAEIAPSGSGVRKMERKIVGNYVKLRLTGGALEELPLESSPYRRLLSALPPPLTLILKATPLPRHMDRARIFDRISNILCGRGISLRRQEPNHYAALRQYVEGGGTCATEGKAVRFDPINICARCPIAGQPHMYIVMVDATNKSVEEVVQTNCMRILVFDLINDTDEQLQLLLGLVEAVESSVSDALVPVTHGVVPLVVGVAQHMGIDDIGKRNGTNLDDYF